MDMVIDFPGGARVDTHFGPFIVTTDQPLQGGGSGSAPTPFEVFLSSTCPCAEISVPGFCRRRGLPNDGIRIIHHIYPNRMTGLIEKIQLAIQVPPSFPPQYHSALIRSAESCKVKKTLEQPPLFEIVIKKSGSDLPPCHG